MYILGVSCFYHDSAACLLKNGVIVAAAEEERFTRLKHDKNFPKNAIRFVLESEGIDIIDIDAISFYEKPFWKIHRVLNQFIQNPPSFKIFRESLADWFVDFKSFPKQHRLGHTILKPYGTWEDLAFGKLYIHSKLTKGLRFNKNILFFPHHLSHAASCFYLSPFKTAAIVTIDGVGEKATTTISLGKNNSITPIKEINYPNSLGLLYSSITSFLGFSVNNSEYKVMALAGYGNPAIFREAFGRLLKMNKDGSFKLNLKYFKFTSNYRMYTKRLSQLFGISPRIFETNLEQVHFDIAAALQETLEKAVFSLLDYAYRTTQVKQLCLAGGVALNSLLNGKLTKASPFDEIFIQPAAGDAGGSVGAALNAYYALNPEGERHLLNHVYYGPHFTDDEIEFFLKTKNIKYKKFKSFEECLQVTAEKLNDGQIMGWHQGRMEFGPRALGNRSILANPMIPGIKNIINKKVKHREKFRPFAPAVCIENAESFFEMAKGTEHLANFMLGVYPVKNEYINIIPAAVHVDGTARVQTVSPTANPQFHSLLKTFEKLAGYPILLNTSFNVRGEPIVCCPYDSFRCMMGTEIDSLVMGNYLIERSNNYPHAWDSSDNAID